MSFSDNCLSRGCEISDLINRRTKDVQRDMYSYKWPLMVYELHVEKAVLSGFVVLLYSDEQ